LLKNESGSTLLNDFVQQISILVWCFLLSYFIRGRAEKKFVWSYES